MLCKIFRYFLIGVPVTLTCIDYFGYVARVDGVSMQPLFNEDKTKSDYVFLSRWLFHTEGVHRGDVVSLISPRDHRGRLIKRIIGMPGDVVETIGYQHEILLVPDGHCWIEGDNDLVSLDSNSFGPVPLGLVQARATHIVWPPNRWRRIPRMVPSSRRPIKTATTPGI